MPSFSDTLTRVVCRYCSTLQKKGFYDDTPCLEGNRKGARKDSVWSFFSGDRELQYNHGSVAARSLRKIQPNNQARIPQKCDTVNRAFATGASIVIKDIVEKNLD